MKHWDIFRHHFWIGFVQGAKVAWAVAAAIVVIGWLV